MQKICDLQDLSSISKEIRKNIILSLNSAGSGHLGGSLGLADVFTVLYFNELNHDSTNPKWYFRDRLVLSIGHVAPVLYSSLALAGYFSVDELKSLRKLGSRLQGHPSLSFELPGLELSSGSLGQGLSIGVGMSIALKYDKLESRVYVVMGDGELQEGSVWEAAMSASFHKLDNLIAIVDRNSKQIDGDTENVMALEPLKSKWEAFGWECFECDGNNIVELLDVFSKMKVQNSKPKLLIAKTKMGSGVKSIEDDYKWHGKAPNNQETEEFINQLS